MEIEDIFSYAIVHDGAIACLLWDSTKQVEIDKNEYSFEIADYDEDGDFHGMTDIAKDMLTGLLWRTYCVDIVKYIQYASTSSNN
jgi:hypothetical protein